MSSENEYDCLLSMNLNELTKPYQLSQLIIQLPSYKMHVLSEQQQHDNDINDDLVICEKLASFIYKQQMNGKHLTKNTFNKNDFDNMINLIHDKQYNSEWIWNVIVTLQNNDHLNVNKINKLQWIENLWNKRQIIINEANQYNQNNDKINTLNNDNKNEVNKTDSNSLAMAVNVELKEIDDPNPNQTMSQQKMSDKKKIQEIPQNVVIHKSSSSTSTGIKNTENNNIIDANLNNNAVNNSYKLDDNDQIDKEKNNKIIINDENDNLSASDHSKGRTELIVDDDSNNSNNKKQNDKKKTGQQISDEITTKPLETIVNADSPSIKYYTMGDNDNSAFGHQRVWIQKLFLYTALFHVFILISYSIYTFTMNTMYIYGILTIWISIMFLWFMIQGLYIKSNGYHLLCALFSITLITTYILWWHLCNLLIKTQSNHKSEINAFIEIICYINFVLCFVYYVVYFRYIRPYYHSRASSKNRVESTTNDNETPHRSLSSSVIYEKCIAILLFDNEICTMYFAASLYQYYTYTSLKFICFSCLIIQWIVLFVGYKVMNTNNAKCSIFLLICYGVLLIMGYMPFSSYYISNEVKLRTDWKTMVFNAFFLMPLLVFIIRISTIYWIYQAYKHFKNGLRSKCDIEYEGVDINDTPKHVDKYSTTQDMIKNAVR